jgi:hypothetical protein
MSDIRDWHRSEHPWKRMMLIIPALFAMIIPLIIWNLIESNPIPFILAAVLILVISIILGTSFKKNKKVQMVSIMLFATSSMSMMGAMMMLQGGPILLLSFFMIMILLLGSLFLSIFLIDRKVELITITHEPPISPYLIGDLKRYIYWVLKENNLKVDNYTNQMEAFYKGNMFKVIIKASTLNEKENAEYSIVCRTKGKMDDPEFRTVKEIISEGIGNLLSNRKIDEYPRPVEVICRRGHRDVVLQPATGNYYCMKCKKIYSQDKLKITWDPPV